MSDDVLSNSPSSPRHPSFGLAWACAALSGLVVIAWLIDAIVTTRLAGHSTFEVSALAAGICWTGAMLSLVLLHLLRLRGSPMAGAFLGMLIRMTIPLFIVLMTTTHGGALADAGLPSQLVLFYLVTLAIETCLSVVLMKSAPRSAATQSAVSGGSAAHG